MTVVYDVIVVGGGPIGAACARELALSGRKVLLLDRGTSIGEAWRAAAGMLAPQIEARVDDPLLELGLASREMYRELGAILLDSTGVDIGLSTDGILHVATNEADATALRSKVEWQRNKGHSCVWLEPADVSARWNWLAPVLGALWAPRDGALNPQLLVAALLADAERSGAAVIQETVCGLATPGDRVTGVFGTNRYSAERVVLAAGAWTTKLEGLPRALPVEPVRGQMAALPWPDGVAPGIVYGPDHYIVARGGEALAGSTMEYAGFRPEVTSAGQARILDGITALSPAFGHQKASRAWAGLRPMTPDGLPIIGPDLDVEGLWYATGHGRNGILLAAITGAIMRRLFEGEHAGLQVSALSIARFGNRQMSR